MGGETIEVIVISSGSKGNSTAVLSEDGGVYLFDAGVSAKKIETALNTEGYSLGDIRDIFVSHEHSDHVSSLNTVAKRSGATIHINTTTLNAISNKHIKDSNSAINIETMDVRGTIELDGMSVEPIILSHDVVPTLGFSINEGGRVFSIITDTGKVNSDIIARASRSHAILIESNHDEDMLMYGPYPYHLKMRIRGPYGHMSNDYCADVLRTIIKEQELNGGRILDRILLGHLSDKNNTPEKALYTNRNLLSYYIDDGLKLDVIPYGGSYQGFTV